MKSCSTEQFTDLVKAVITNREMGLQTPTLDEFLIKVEAKYIELGQNGDWEAGTSAQDQESLLQLRSTSYVERLQQTQRSRSNQQE